MEAMREQIAAEQESRRALLPLFQARVKRDGDYVLPYRLFVPKELETGKRYPIVVFLHGLGECGVDNASHIVNNEGAAVWVNDQLAGGEPRFVLAPQCPDPKEPKPLFGQPTVRWTTPALHAILALLEDLQSAYPIDEQRMYLTGLSLGGYGVWMLQCMSMGKFAAVVSCCPACLANGSVYTNGIADCAMTLDNTALWMFHAADDAAVPVEVSRAMKMELELNGHVCGRDFRYTEYPAELGYNHGCWVAAYADEEMRKWMFAQRKT